jgi:methylenetetrahydrofolate--tRNA-(uracil-5-)-methyltransferase
VESAASGLWVGLTAGLEALGKELPIPLSTTAIGALANYVSTFNTAFQPMNINFGIIDTLPQRIKDKQKRAEAIYNRSMEVIDELIKGLQ